MTGKEYQTGIKEKKNNRTEMQKHMVAYQSVPFWVRLSVSHVNYFISSSPLFNDHFT